MLQWLKDRFGGGRPLKPEVDGGEAYNVTSSLIEEEAPSLSNYIRAISIEPASASAAAEEHPLTKLLRYLSANWEHGMYLLDSEAYADVIALWQPMEENLYFDPTHLEWSDKSYYRTMVRSAIMQLVTAHTQRPSGDLKADTVATLKYLEILTRDAPLLEKSGDDGTLDPDQALFQDQNFHQTLDLALRWFEVFSPLAVSLIVDSSESEVSALQRLVGDREKHLIALIAEHERAAAGR